MNNFDFKNFVSNIFHTYKTKTKNHHKNLGILVLLSCNRNRHDVFLSRCFLRDREQMDLGYNNFNKEFYNSFFSKSILNLPNYDTNAIAEAIYSKFNSDVHVTSLNPPHTYTIENSDEDNNDDIEATNNEMSILMAQLGLPTEFTSTKSQKFLTNNSRNQKLQDLDKIFECIRQNILSLLSDDNELIKQWALKQRRDATMSSPSFGIFCSYLLLSDVIDNEIKKLIKSLIKDDSPANGTIEHINEVELLASFDDTISNYVDTKCIDWIENLNLSDQYKSTITQENPDFLKYLLDSIGFAYQTVTTTESYQLYPIIPAKAVVYSLKHDFRLYVDDTGYSYGDDDILPRDADEDDPMNKYYFQRYRFFDKFDEGILLDKESWYSVTPAIIAQYHATRFKSLLTQNDQCPIIIDAFCGSGGNAIRFAEQGFIVLAVDIDNEKLKILLHNAVIYGVQDYIVPICHDYYDLVDWLGGPQCPESISSLFSLTVGINISPPWGGPEYLDQSVYDISVMDLSGIMSVARSLSSNVACFLPRQSDCGQIIDWLMDLPGTDDCTVVELEHNCVNNKVKALTLYTHRLVRPSGLATV